MNDVLKEKIVLEGRMLENNDKDKVIVSSALLDKMDVDYKVAVGSSLDIYINKQKKVSCEIVGVINDKINSFGAKSISEDTMVYFSDINEAFNNYSFNNIHLCKLNDYKDTMEVYNRMSNSVSFSNQGCFVSRLIYEYIQYEPMLGILIIILSTFGIIMLISSLMSLYVTICDFTIHRKGFIGLCKTYGLTNLKLLNLQILQNVKLYLKSSITSIIITMPIGIGVTILINNYLNEWVNSESINISIHIGYYFYAVVAVNIIFFTYSLIISISQANRLNKRTIRDLLSS